MSTDQIEIYSYTLNESFIFKAYVTNFSDSYTSNWKSENVFGKMDPIATFQNTSRKITLEIDVPNADILEARNNFISISKLISGLYPVYNDTNKNGTATIASPPLFRIKYANLITNAVNKQGLLCYFDAGFTFNPDFTVGVFNTAEEIYPKLYKASLAFTVLHEQPLGRNVQHQSRIGDLNFPYNLDNLTPIALNNQSLKGFETKNASLAKYLEQAQEQQFVETTLASAQRRNQQEPTATNEIDSAIIRARRRELNENIRDTPPILSRPIGFDSTDNTFIFGTSVEEVNAALNSDVQNAKKLQAKLYELIRSGANVKGAVLNRTGSGFTTFDINTKPE
jgi:hypothetical protein